MLAELEAKQESATWIQMSAYKKLLIMSPNIQMKSQSVVILVWAIIVEKIIAHHIIGVTTWSMALNLGIIVSANQVILDYFCFQKNEKFGLNNS